MYKMRKNIRFVTTSSLKKILHVRNYSFPYVNTKPVLSCQKKHQIENKESIFLYIDKYKVILLVNHK